MAISITDVLNIHPFVPNPDYQSPYPVGIWKAARTQVTDASGGQLRWVVSPPSATEAAKYLWSLEGWSWITSVLGVDRGIYVEVNTGEVVSRAGGTEVMRFGITMPCPNSVRPAMLSGPYTNYNPSMFEFIHQPGGGNANMYIMDIPNVNAEVYTMTFWGYFWNTQARRLASGPRR